MRGGGEITASEGSVGDLGEWGVIAALKARMPGGPLTSVGIGDDAAVVTTPSGSVVAAVDQMIEGRHFRHEWSSAYDIGVKAAARSLADIAAMGAVNTALLVALAAPGTLPASWATALADGLAAEAVRAGAGVVGGDTARADSVTISVTALGDLQGREPVRRSGAQPGDIVAVAGPLGHSAAGLALLAGRFVLVPADPAGRARANRAPDAVPAGLAGLVAAHLRPAPPYDAGPDGARLGATAMIDVSDGLLADLGHIATASGVQINITAAAVPPGAALIAAAVRLAHARKESRATVAADSPGPMAPAAATAADAADPGVAAATAMEWVLTGGEDHSLIATFPPAVRLPERWRVIGDVRPGTGVTVNDAPHAGPGGWQHFQA